jgi:hypothetical protein
MAKKRDEEAFNVTTEEAASTPPVTQIPVVGVSVDLAINVVNLIDSLATRGVFKGDELFAVGFTRQKFVELIAPYVTPQQS